MIKALEIALVSSARTERKQAVFAALRRHTAWVDFLSRYAIGATYRERVSSLGGLAQALQAFNNYSPETNYV